jgi:hypothetical protein
MRVTPQSHWSFINGINPMHFRLHLQIWPPLAANSIWNDKVLAIFGGKMMFCTFFPPQGALVMVKNVCYTSKPWVLSLMATNKF